MSVVSSAGRLVLGYDKTMSEAERIRADAETTAERILSVALRRRRWIAADRDAVADEVERAIMKELKRRATGKQPEEGKTE